MGPKVLSRKEEELIAEILRGASLLYELNFIVILELGQGDYYHGRAYAREYLADHKWEPGYSFNG